MPPNPPTPLQTKKISFIHYATLPLPRGGFCIAREQILGTNTQSHFFPPFLKTTASRRQGCLPNFCSYPYPTALVFLLSWYAICENKNNNRKEIRVPLGWCWFFCSFFTLSLVLLSVVYIHLLAIYWVAEIRLKLCVSICLSNFFFPLATKSSSRATRSRRGKESPLYLRCPSTSLRFWGAEYSSSLCKAHHSLSGKARFTLCKVSLCSSTSISGLAVLTSVLGKESNLTANDGCQVNKPKPLRTMGRLQNYYWNFREFEMPYGFDSEKKCPVILGDRPKTR